MEEILKINKARLPIVIGHEGNTKLSIEKRCKVLLDIDSHNGEVIINGNGNYYDVYIAKKIIECIARGFSPKNAFKLLNDNYTSEILHIKDYVGKNDRRIQQIKGRVIGKDGKVKTYIENKFGCGLAVFGNTITIISRSEDISSIREILESILNGSQHTTAFKLIKLRSNGFKTKKADVPRTNENNDIDNISF